MSSILEALRKLERDKLHQPGSTPQIAADLLRPAHSQSRVSGATVVVTLVLAVLVGGGWWLWHRRPVSAPITSPAPALQTRPSPPAALRTTGEGIFEVLKPQLPQTTTAAAVRQAAAVTAPALVAAAPQSPAPVESALPTRDQPVVSNIVYTSTPAERLAVIDGMPVMEGTDIDGLTVVTIEAHRVLFSDKGGKFYVRLAESERHP